MDLEHIYKVVGILAVLVFFYTLVAKKIENSSISGPIVYVLLGLALGAHGFGIIGSDAEANDLRLLADITLALILFADAAHSNLQVLKTKASYPSRMLGLGLPGAILLGFAGAVLLFPQLSLVEAGILGTMLAATDAALGKAVITNDKVPAEVREGLNVESGLNDGLCVPILLVLIAMGSSAHAEVSASHALMLVAEELGIGLAVGLGFAFIGAKLLTISHKNGWLSEVWVQLTVATLALASFAVAQTLHGSGYIAAFSGGLLFGYLHEKHTHALVLTTESIAELFAMLTWILFGAAVVGEVFNLFDVTILAYAVVSLTLVRMLPIYISFFGSDVPSEQRLFMGWFGPRGLASIVFAVIVMEAELPGSKFIALVVTCTVLMSLVLHGITAKPWANRIGKR